MSVLIKDFKIPTGDEPRMFLTHFNDDGTANMIAMGYPQKPYSLVAVPPNGRLIDADALIEDLERQCKEVFRIDAVSPDDYWITRNEAYNEALWKSWVESFGEYLKTRPTIIEAEEKT